MVAELRYSLHEAFQGARCTNRSERCFFQAWTQIGSWAIEVTAHHGPFVLRPYVGCCAMTSVTYEIGTKV